MAEHRSFDLLSFLTGLLALVAAGLYLLDDLLDDHGVAQVDEAVVGATFVVVLGAAGLLRAVATLWRRPTERD